MAEETPIWDAIIIGAGPAGSGVAMQLARSGASVLLVEKSRFPREKVCGCCLSSGGAHLLEAMGLGDLLHRAGARRTDHFRLHTRGRRCSLVIPGGYVLSRGAFDQALVAAAVEAGATFLDSTSAQLGGKDSTREVILTRDSGRQHHRARIIVACTGLAGRLLDGETGMATTIAARSLMGCSAIVDQPPDQYEAGIIHMAHGRAGYAGLVRLEDDRLDVAAALHPKVVQAMGGPGPAVESLLRENGLPSVESNQRLEWHGTPLLTRRRSSVAGDRLFVAGDAAGYVEPFTGEGMAWALASARAVAPLALQAIRQWDPSLISAWNREYSRQLGGRQRRCRWLTRGLRSAWATGLVHRVLAWSPRLAAPFVAAIQRPWRGLERGATT